MTGERNLPAMSLKQWLAAEPFALAMSSGFFGFFAHCGVMTVLEDSGLHPTRITGSSAGALVGGMWASGLDAPAMRDELLRLRREDFWDPHPGLGLLRGHRFRGLLDALLRSATFDACRTPVAVSVYDVWTRRTRVVSEGSLAPALQASCTVPGLFHPVWHQGRPLLDGGILDRPGLEGMPTGERVLFHHLASRSPWRRVNGTAMAIPRRRAMTTLVIEDLPRVGPFRLGQGAHAFENARRATSRALERPVIDAQVHVAGD